MTALLVPASIVGAVDYGGVGGKPANPVASNPRTQSIFIYTLNLNQSIQDGIQVFNNTDTERTITLDAVDSVIASGGAFSCAQAADAKTDVGKWINLDATTVTIPAGGSKVVPFTLTVPAKADVGEHDGCITTQDASMTQATDNAGVVLSFRSATRVVVTIPGEIIKKLTMGTTEIKQVSDGSYTISPSAVNEGNVSLDTKVNTKISTIFATTVEQQSGTYPVLPKSTASWNFTFNQPFWGGWYKINTDATYNSNPTAELGVPKGDSQTVHSKTEVIFTPPTLGGALIELLILALIVAGITVYVRKQLDIRKIRKNWQSYSVKADDTITSLAKDHHVSWKKLARANRLKPPYSLKSGQKLRVPAPRGK